MKIRVILGCLWLLAGAAVAQVVENVRFSQTEDDQVVITYDIAQADRQKFSVEVWVSQDGGKNFTIQPRSVSGDVGKEVEGGRGKRIVWDVLSDIRKLEGPGFVVKVVAMRVGNRVEKLPGGAEMEFVWIAPGTFVMGSPDSELGRESDEGPQHQVTISKGFWLGKYEITQGQWEAVMRIAPWSGKDYVQANPNNPGVYISWEDVQKFIQELNDVAGEVVYRLPTEAEWEYACRAGTTTRWSFGDDESQLKDYAWYSANAWNVGERYAHQVGTKKPNPWGLYDMHGNVWEWCQDWHGSYTSSSQTDPRGSTTGGSSRVGRGGGFGLIVQGSRSAYRDHYDPGDRSSVIGARLLRTR